MKRVLLPLLIATIVVAAGFAQQAPRPNPPDGAPSGGRPEGGVGTERPEGAFRGFAPELLAERAQAEVEIWDGYLSLTDAQKPKVLETIQKYFETFTSFMSQGVRPNPEAMQGLQDEKNYAIYEILTQEQQAAMAYYYEEIIAAITAAGRTGFGPGAGRAQ